MKEEMPFTHFGVFDSDDGPNVASASPSTRSSMTPNAQSGNSAWNRGEPLLIDYLADRMHGQGLQLEVGYRPGTEAHPRREAGLISNVSPCGRICDFALVFYRKIKINICIVPAAILTTFYT